MAVREPQLQSNDVALLPDEPELAAPRGLRAPGTARMIGGSLIGAVMAYLFQVYGGRALGTTAFAPIALLWTAFFIVATVILVPLEQFVTREASRGRRVLRDDRKTIVLVIGGAALLLAGFVYLTNDLFFNAEPIFVLQAAAVVTGFGVMQVGKGLLAGHRRFAQYGSMLAWEGVLRLVAAGAFLAVSVSAPALGWAMVAAPFCVLIVRPFRYDRETVSGVAPTRAAGFLSSYVLGSSASQLLLGGAPLGVGALGGSEALRSVVFVTFTLYRAPLTLIYNLQGRLLSLLVRMEGRADLRRGLLRLMGLGLLLVGLAALVGWLVGPLVVELLFGAEFRPSAVVAALAAAGVIAGSVTQLMSQALVANGSTGQLASAWVGGLLAGLVTMLALPGAPDLRVAVGFVVGEVVAFGLAGWRTLRR
ncbi:MAG: lipopolysaccharide biosynthesis protein [Acidimicrobiia bacterium]